AFAVLFFVGVGMMFEWRVVVFRPMTTLYVLGTVLIFNAGCVAALMHLCKFPLRKSLIVGATLAQIGEFSFIIVAQGIALDMISDKAMSVLVAASILSIALNPFILASAPRLENLLARTMAWARRASLRPDPLAVKPAAGSRRVQVVVAGSGVLADRLREGLVRRGFEFTSIVQDKAAAEAMAERGMAVHQGDPDEPMLLAQAGVGTARVLVLAGVDLVRVRNIRRAALQINGEIVVLAHAAGEDDERQLAEAGVVHIFREDVAAAECLEAAVASLHGPQAGQGGGRGRPPRPAPGRRTDFPTRHEEQS
ncbi:MAG: cation:proton antiporter, partial [Duodenibacillus sp.]|nr:cation:proton antiporter [Duodenibacillus sp.]